MRQDYISAYRTVYSVKKEIIVILQDICYNSGIVDNDKMRFFLGGGSNIQNLQR